MSFRVNIQLNCDLCGRGPGPGVLPTLKPLEAVITAEAFGWRIGTITNWNGPLNISAHCAICNEHLQQKIAAEQREAEVRQKLRDTDCFEEVDL